MLQKAPDDIGAHPTQANHSDLHAVSQRFRPIYSRPMPDRPAIRPARIAAPLQGS
jgi:hypothetical protein